MIRGLVALVTSGILLNPMVILGIVCGICIMNRLSEDEVIEIFQNTDFYTGMFIMAFLFTFFFERVYHTGGKKINWKATTGIAFGRFITLFITTVFTCLFVFSMTFGESNINKEPSEELQQEIPTQSQQEAPTNTTSQVSTDEIIFN